jgi:hypothetical protein
MKNLQMEIIQKIKVIVIDIIQEPKILILIIKLINQILQMGVIVCKQINSIKELDSLHNLQYANKLLINSQFQITVHYTVLYGSRTAQEIINLLSLV